MPNPFFVAFEMMLMVLFALCLRHAARLGPSAVWQLVAGVLFGLLLEWATLRQLHAYRYGRFLLMLGQVPLMVGVGWGVIIYSVRLFSDATSLPEWARPMLDGLLALTIDLAMDAVAIRLGMWDWGRGPQDQYFGVPYANFWAWFWVVFTFSVGLRGFARPTTWAGRWLAPMGAILLGLVNLIAMNTLMTMDLPEASYMLTITLMLGVALALVFWLRPRFSLCRSDPLVFWVPFAFHAYFLVVGLLSGVILRPPVLLLMSLTMALVALYLHRGSLWAWRNRLPTMPDTGSAAGG
jgi:hypothetical protein